MPGDGACPAADAAGRAAGAAAGAAGANGFGPARCKPSASTRSIAPQSRQANCRPTFWAVRVYDALQPVFGQVFCMVSPSPPKTQDMNEDYISSQPDPECTRCTVGSPVAYP